MAAEKRRARPPAKPAPRRPRSGKASARARPVAFFLLKWTLVAAIWLAFLGGAVIAFYARDLPDTSGLNQITRTPSVTLVTGNGQILASYGDLYGDYIGLKQMSPYLPKAVMAIEDRRFYSHGGVDPFGLARAIYVNLRAGHLVQGGSTITQQLAKNLFLTPERTLKRKIQETLLALWLEREFTKDEILTLYLNRVYLGAGTFGVDAAAHKYFGKSAKDLTLTESAIIAGLLKAPSRFNPASDPDAATARAKVVIASMVDAEFISQDEATRSANAKAAMGETAAVRRTGRYFADWVLDQVSGFVGNTDHDLTVITTLDPTLQDAAEATVASVMDAEGAKRKASQAAVVVMTPDGAVRAMVGGRDYDSSEFNRAAQALRQPGSAFKLFVFLAAMEAGYSPDDHMIDGPVQIGGWRPGNYNDKYYGDVSLREAFARSLNSVSVQLTQRVGAGRVVAVAKRLGITADLQATPSIALGTSEVSLLELTAAYAAFDHSGEGVWPYGIEEIRDNTGAVLFKRAGSGPGRVVGASNLMKLQDLMGAVVGWGTGRAAALDRPAAGKTGTSQEFRDAWFLGFTADLVAGVWVGNDDSSPMDKVSGGSLPVKIWHEVMAAGVKGLPPRPLPGGGTDEGVLAEAGAPIEALGTNGAGAAGGSSGDFISDLLSRLTGGSSGGGSSAKNKGAVKIKPGGKD